MSDKNFQTLIAQVYYAIDNVVGIIDENANIIACSQPDMIGKRMDKLSLGRLTEETLFDCNGYTYGKLSRSEDDSFRFAFVKGTGSVAKKQMKLMILLFDEMKKHDKELHDKNSFLKGIILDNILPGDVFLKAREMNFHSDVKRVCILFKIENDTNVVVYDILSSLFPEKNKDFVITTNETDIVVIKELEKDFNEERIERLAKSLAGTLLKKYSVHVRIGIGSVVDNIRDVATSFKEAQVALEIGEVFNSERNVVSYGELGIARLIYQVPTTICKMFLKEVFKKNSVDILDEETLFTIQKFFENNLNVSETARKLFIHRNTLVYRIERVYKLTNLDLRQFEHAILFKVAMMVNKYLKSNLINF